MLSFISNNIGTICVAFALVLIIALIITKLIRNKKKGVLSCGCNCAHCAMAGQCGKNKSAS